MREAVICDPNCPGCPCGELPDGPAIDASNADAARRRETVGRVYRELFGRGDPAWVGEWVRDGD